MKFFWVKVVLLVLALAIVSAVKGRKRPSETLCTADKFSGFRMVFPERNIKNYALKKNAFSKGLKAVTLCSFVKDNPDDTSGEFQCPYSYAVNGSDNEMSFCTSPTLRVIINGEKRDTKVGIEDGNFHNLCLTWTSANGGYQFYKDGKVVAGGKGLKEGYTIRPEGNTVLGQDQDKLAGVFNPAEAFVGELVELNVWDRVLPRGVIVDQHNYCHIGKGSLNWWAQFKTDLHGDVKVLV